MKSKRMVVVANKMMLLNMFVALFVLLLFCFVSVSLSINNSIQNSLINNTEGLDKFRQHLDEKFEELIDNSIDFQTSTGYSELFSKVLNDNVENLNAYEILDFKLALDSFFTHDNDLQRIIFYNTNKNTYTIYNVVLKGIDTVSVQESKMNFDSSNITIHPTGHDVILSSNSVAISTTLAKREGDAKNNYLILEYSLESFDSIFRNNSQSILGDVFVFNGNDELFYSTDKSYPSETVDVIKKMVLSSYKGEQNGDVTVDGVRYFYESTNVIGTEYTIVNMVSDELEAAYSSQVNIIIIVTVCLAVVLILIFLMSMFRVRSRFNLFMEAMTNIRKNNMEYRIPIKNVEDEIGSISVVFNEMCDELLEHSNRVHRYKAKQQEAEFNQLQATINPHILYNTLEIIRDDVFEHGNERASDMISAMSRVYRYMVKADMFVTVEREMEFCDKIIRMYNIRWSENFDFRLDIAEDIMQYGIIKGLFQPLIENYFVHAYSADAPQNRLFILGSLTNGYIFFNVWNNGAYISEDKLAELRQNLNVDINKDSSHYGIANVHSRIKNIYGEECGLTINSRKESGTTVTIKIKPYLPEEIKRQHDITKR